MSDLDITKRPEAPADAVILAAANIAALVTRMKKGEPYLLPLPDGSTVTIYGGDPGTREVGPDKARLHLLPSMIKDILPKSWRREMGEAAIEGFTWGTVFGLITGD